MIVWPGLRRSVSAISRLFNSASFDAPLTHSAIPTRAASGTTATFTRATTKTWQNNDGYLVTGLAGEIGFPGARRVDNLIRLGAAQSSTLAVAANVTMTLPAGAYQFSMGAGTGTATFSGTGGATGTLAASASARTFVAKTISAGTLIVTASVATLVDIQVVSMVAETDQTTEREYVSIGVESAPYYHGSFVDGVKCFATDISGNPIPTSYTYDAVSLSGVAGTYVSTPDSVANSITGDIDIRWYGSLVDWTPAGYMVFSSKWSGIAGGKSYEFYMQQGSVGKLALIVSSDGTATTSALSSVAVAFADGATGGVRVTRAAATGAVNFYTSTDGDAWTLLGTADVATTAGSLYDSATQVEIGTDAAGTGSPLSGKCKWCQIYNGINGTLAVDFNASRYAGGTTLTGSTGETWTLQGNAVIHPTNQPLLGYQAEGARTNLALWNRDWTNAAWVKTSVTAAKDQAGADGAANSASSLTATGANGTTLQAYVGASTTRCFGVLMKRITGTGSISVTSDGVNYTDITSQINSSTYTLVQDSRALLNPLFGVKIATSGDKVAVDYAMFEAASFTSSYIATTTIAVARNADVLTYSGGDIPNLKTLSASFRREVGVSSTGVIAALSTGFELNSALARLSNATASRFDVVAGGVAQVAQATSNAYTPGTQSSMSISLATDNTRMSKDGVAQTDYTSCTIPSTTRVEIGMVQSGEQLNGTIRGVYGWTRNLSQSELNAITAL